MNFKMFSVLLVFILAVLGLCCLVGFSLVAAKGATPLVLTWGLLFAAATLVAEHGL